MNKVQTALETEEVRAERMTKQDRIRAKAEAEEIRLKLLGGLPPMTTEEALAMQGAHAIGELPPDRGPRGAEWS